MQIFQSGIFSKLKEHCLLLRLDKLRLLAHCLKKSCKFKHRDNTVEKPNRYLKKGLQKKYDNYSIAVWFKVERLPWITCALVYYRYYQFKNVISKWQLTKICIRKELSNIFKLIIVFEGNCWIFSNQFLSTRFINFWLQIRRRKMIENNFHISLKNEKQLLKVLFDSRSRL